MLERRGIISGYEGSKPRQVLISEADVPRILINLAEGTSSGRQSTPVASAPSAAAAADAGPAPDVAAPEDQPPE
jgi:S-DNA-T family DNA segregation ATPase FtsK/SpoIIIE